jgi:hypothetical protein
MGNKKEFFHRKFTGFVYTRLLVFIDICYGTGSPVNRDPLSFFKKSIQERREIPSIITPAMSAVRIVTSPTGDLVGPGFDAGADVAPSVTSAAGMADPCSGVLTVVTGSVPSGATTDMTVLYGAFKEGLLTVTVYCPGSISLWKP